MRELNPMLSALAKQAFEKTARLWPALFSELVGPSFCQEYIGVVADEMGKTYGVDWINLGYRLQASMTIRRMCEDIHDAFNGVDWKGEPLSKFPLMQRG